MIRQTLDLAPINADSVTARLHDRLKTYDGLGSDTPRLKLVKEVNRRFCNLYLYSLSETSSPDLVVKVPIGHADIAYKEKSHDISFVDRPRLFGRANPLAKSQNEYAALKRIETHFDDEQDSRFGVVRIYDMFPEEQAMVMQWVEHPSLRELLYQSHRFGNANRARRLEPAFEHMGAWLRKHHELPSLDHCETRNKSREDYLESIVRFATYLTEHSGNSKLIHWLHERIIAGAMDVLPAELPTGQVHGDYAPRNAFVGPDSRITVFDTLGRFDAPIYEDIAKLLMTVKACGPQLMSGGLLYDARHLQRYERHFLKGYYSDEPIPLKTIRLFEAQLLLEFWTATVYRHREGRGLRRVAKGLRRTIWQSGFKSYLRSIVTDISRQDI